MKYEPFVNIIIPLHVVLSLDDYERFKNDFKHFLNLDYQNYKITIVTDKKVTLPFHSKKVIHLVTNAKHTTSPAEKRDFALRHTKADICAFIDDDAYPNKDWLKNGVGHFLDPKIIAVGGPGVTPPENSFWQKIGGYIIESYVCSGGVQYRFYKYPKKLFVDDYPAYNLFIRSKILRQVGGWASTYYGGEDTFLCIKLIKSGDILYDPDVLVYHHRRAFPLGHLKQIKNVAIHRGYFFKRYPATSRRIIYLLPTTLTLGLIISIVATILFPVILFPAFIATLTLFWLIGAASVYRHRVNLMQSLIAGFGIITTHITYGVFFIKGLFTDNLTR
jgi:cellulose synthase/poly-beta-1,6-N-acetylglucosamine synthase-like glycosyltransferase